MKWNDLHSVYFIGVGGIGMSALARYFVLHGCRVAGYDRTATPLTDKLAEEGIEIHFNEDVSAIPKEVDLVIYTPAIPQSNKELRHFKTLGIPMMKRAEVLGFISNQGNCLAVAGTHGKTTTSSMLAHILNLSEKGVNAFVGGIMTNYNSNYLFRKGATDFVVEADEFDRSFLYLTPNIAVITSMDADHLDIYKEHHNLIDTFMAFARKVTGSLVVHESLYQTFKNIAPSTFTYGFDSKSSFFADKLQVVEGHFVFNLHYPEGVLTNVTLRLPGRHNVENAVAASAMAWISGTPMQSIKEAFETYNGVKRRFEIVYNNGGIVYIDDYAHHPKELTAAIEAARALYPGKRITAIFQPHLYSRTRDFAEEFAQALGGLDELILLEIYPARELPIPGIDSAFLLDKVALTEKMLVPDDMLMEVLRDKNPEVLMTLGAGNIDQFVKPINKLLAA